MSYVNLLFKGKLVDSENSLLKVFEKRYGSVPLKNPDGVPTVVTTISRSKGSNENGEHIYQPLLLRTYDNPDEDEHEVGHGKIDLAESTSNVKLVEAMAATSAVPGLVDRVQIEIDGEKRSLADGFLFANDPTVVALNEARELYPRRPIGLVMSFGFDDNNANFSQRAIAIARLSHPNLHYQRIAPGHIFKDFGSTETDMKKIALLEEEAYNYVITDTGVQRLLDVSLQKLFDKHQERHWQSEEVNGFHRFNKTSIQDSIDYQRRTQQRFSILGSSMARSKRLLNYRKSVLGHLEHDGVYNLGETDENNVDTFEDNEVSQNRTETIGFCCCRPRKNAIYKRDSTLVHVDRMQKQYSEEFLADKPKETQAEAEEVVVEHDSFLNGDSDVRKAKVSFMDENEVHDAKLPNNVEKELIEKKNSNTNNINIGDSSSGGVPKLVTFNITTDETQDTKKSADEGWWKESMILD